MPTPKPNIIYILADDLGYGDVGCNEPACRIPTPNLDRLAERGMRFTDAHATSAVCTPSRYSILTGRYNWRSRLKQGIVWEWDGSLIEPDRMTIASFLKGEGYDTACFGKWHLGWDWPTIDGKHPNQTLPFGVNNREVAYRRHIFSKNVDFTGRIPGGPTDRGFDRYFGVDIPNFPPYAWFEDDYLTEQPLEQKPAAIYGSPGPAVGSWSHEAMLPELTRRATRYIESHTPGDGYEPAPYFLYLPLTAPHSPIVPNAEFRGRSGIGPYGDFVCEVDDVVGAIMQSLERSGQAERTIVIFTSDNGPEIDFPHDDEGVYERARRTAHFSNGELRGVKRDVWEGGHRVPLIASWPRRIPTGTVCTHTVGLLDFMATCADILGATLPDDVAEDSVSMWPLLYGESDTPTRDFLIHHSQTGKFAIREGDWVLIQAPTGGDSPEPQWFREQRRYLAHDQPGELFNLVKDLTQRKNCYAEEPELVEHLTALLKRSRAAEAPMNPGRAVE